MYIDTLLYQSGLLTTEKTETFVWVTQKIVTLDNWEMYGYNKKPLCVTKIWLYSYKYQMPYDYQPFGEKC